MTASIEEGARFGVTPNEPRRGHDAALLFGRVALAVVFVVSGYGKIFTGDAFGRVLAARGIPAASILPTLAIIIELGGGLVLIGGLKTRLLAALFAIYTVVATLIAHSFWLNVEPAARAANLLQFDKNLAIIGGFVLLAVVGGGSHSADAWWLGRGRRR